jgi:taurine dioxygenase
MAAIDVRDLDAGYSFGARISGVTRETLLDERVRDRIKEVFEQRGLVIFEDVEPSGHMQLAISNVFGPLKDHPVSAVTRVDQETMPGVIDLRYDPEKDADIVEVDGRPLASWLPWHFDHCYNNELNRAGVLRALTIAPVGGLTGFADGIQLYHCISPELRNKIEPSHIIYTLDLVYSKMRYGRPASFREIKVHPETLRYTEYAKKLPRAIHPAVWTRKSGEKVLHVSPWMAVGIEGHEDPEGDELLAAVCREIISKGHAYHHQWKPTDMLVWDNWRMLHSVSGTNPKYPRRMHRTTIKGDYGLGYFENNRQGDALLEMTV